MASPCSPSGVRRWPARTARVSKAAPSRSLSSLPASHSFVMFPPLQKRSPDGIRAIDLWRETTACRSVVVQIDDGADRVGLGLGGVVTRLLDLVQVLLVDIAGDVLAIEYGAVEMVDLHLAAAHCVDQVRQVLINQPVGADQLGHFLGGTVV